MFHSMKIFHLQETISQTTLQKTIVNLYFRKTTFFPSKLLHWKEKRLLSVKLQEMKFMPDMAEDFMMSSFRATLTYVPGMKGQ